jgi:hypothetical protein
VTASGESRMTATGESSMTTIANPA